MENTVVMNEKQCYEEPSVEVIVLCNDDVVTTSGEDTRPETPID